MAQPAPPMWNIGRQTMFCVPGFRSQLRVHCSNMKAKLALVSSAPLGRPVVPLV